MDTRSVVETYFANLRDGREWTHCFSADAEFVSHVVPTKRVKGRSAFVECTRRFYSMITSVDVVALIVEGDRACALTRYQLQAPQGPAFATEVAEIFRVTDGNIASLDIYFDRSPFPK